MRHFLPGESERLLANELGDLLLDRQIRALLGRVVERPLREQGDQLLAELGDALAGLGADRVQRVEGPERSCGLHL